MVIGQDSIGGAIALAEQPGAEVLRAAAERITSLAARTQIHRGGDDAITTRFGLCQYLSLGADDHAALYLILI